MQEKEIKIALVLDLKAFEGVGLPIVWAWATHFNLSRKIMRVLSGYFEHQRKVQFEGCAAEPLQTTGQSRVACSCALCCNTP